MEITKMYLLSFVFLLLLSCVSQKPLVVASTVDEPPAFPGALGFGKYATGGRGGSVIIVSNLNDSGEGSLREAIKGTKPKIIVFSVSGTIHLESPLSIKANTTIAGQSAPGDGICLADQPVSISGDNVIVRYVRFRMGDRHQYQGKVPGSGHDDALTSSRRKHIIIDHCSLSWSTDEVLSVYAGDSSTVQWNIISEPLNLSYHFEKGKTDFEEHGYGGILGGRHMSVYNNLYAHCKSRTPRFDGNRNISDATEFVDYRNNVIYNWGSNNVYGGEGGNYNVVANYYKPGPSTNRSATTKVANPFKKDPAIPFGRWYISENIVAGAEQVTQNNWLGVSLDKGSEEDIKIVKLAEAIPGAGYMHTNASAAFDRVMEGAGASFRRDTMDQRIINDVKNGRGRIIDVQGGFAHGTPYEQSKMAWPFLKSLAPLPDADKDGMPDGWEREKGLNPADASDASAATLHAFYSNVEVYLNGLLQNPKP